MALISGLAASAAAAALASQSGPPQERPETLARLLECRSIVDSPARLACYDSAAGALDSAERQGEVVVLDRAQVAETRRQMFGFDLPALPRLFGSSGEAEISSVETTLRIATQSADDRWTFRLTDGSTWRQVDATYVRFQNRPDQPVRIRKAALGSFLLTVGDSRAVRVRRQ